MKEKSDLTAKDILKHKGISYYNVRVECSNCGWHGIISVEKGEPPRGTVCPHCRTNNVKKSNQQWLGGDTIE